MIKAHHLTKRYKIRLAVDEISFLVRPERVTGFLNGAGKSATIRMIPGLDAPSSGLVPGCSRRRSDGAHNGAYAALVLAVAMI